jgi:glutamate--cysteine ligase
VCSQAPRLGLQVPFRGGLLKDVAQDVVKLAKEGLVRRGRNEEVFLAPIEEVASSGTILTKIHGA